MRKDTSFSDRKLTEQEFADKYWLGGYAPYQYHTATIDDGRDEREQFLFAQCRALFDAQEWRDKKYEAMLRGQEARIIALEKQLKGR